MPGINLVLFDIVVFYLKPQLVGCFVSVKEHSDIVVDYSQSPGDCYGDGIGGVVGILTATACAHVCDDVTDCVGFVFVSLAAHSTKCYLKKGLCAKTVPKDGIKMYTRTRLSKFTIYHQDVYHSVSRNPSLDCL